MHNNDALRPDGRARDALGQSTGAHAHLQLAALTATAFSTSRWTAGIDALRGPSRGRRARRRWQARVLGAERFAAIGAACGFRRAAGAERLKARNQLPFAVSDQIGAAHIF